MGKRSVLPVTAKEARKQPARPRRPKAAGKAKLPTLAELNKRLAASRGARLAAAEANGIKLIGRTRL